MLPQFSHLIPLPVPVPLFLSPSLLLLLCWCLRHTYVYTQAIYVQRRALATRLMRLTHDAPLCTRVLGTFVDDTANNAGPAAETQHQNQNQTQARPRSMERVAAAAKSLSSRFASTPGGVSKEGGKVVW